MDQATQRLIDSYEAATTYPTALIQSGIPLYNLHSFAKRLSEHAERLFDGEDSAHVDFLESTRLDQGSSCSYLAPVFIEDDRWEIDCI